MKNPSRLYLALATLACSNISAHAAPKHLCEILPKNTLSALDNVDKAANLTKARFSTLVDQAIQVYAPLAATHGGHLRAEADWDDPTVNAYALQVDEDWTVQIFGGLARRPELTEDGFSLVLCHEIGHHLGGFPFNSNPVWDWGAIEGQADYFSTQACARTLWGEALNDNAAFRVAVSPIVKSKCDQSWSRGADQELCYRASQASQSLANLYATVAVKPAPNFATPDPLLVGVTSEDHPDPQCRLDTLFHGALCATAFDPYLIPGRHHPSGQGSAEAEQDAAKVSCDGPDSRPRCWFRSSLHP